MVDINNIISLILTYPVKLTGDAADGAAGTTVFDISCLYEFLNHVFSNKIDALFKLIKLLDG